ncbi:MAG: hypothetical protein ACLFU1_07250, partial [Alphaproteobacteria bacterium]
ARYFGDQERIPKLGCSKDQGKANAHVPRHSSPCIINGIENFWNQAKRHMRKYNGIPKQNFELFLKECEWRFNEETPTQLLDDLKNILKEKY